jgi:hypothetical protein
MNWPVSWSRPIWKKQKKEAIETAKPMDRPGIKQTTTEFIVSFLAFWGLWNTLRWQSTLNLPLEAIPGHLQGEVNLGEFAITLFAA